MNPLSRASEIISDLADIQEQLRRAIEKAPNGWGKREERIACELLMDIEKLLFKQQEFAQRLENLLPLKSGTAIRSPQ